ncbi:DUF4279 domain-containing protein [Kitasatospora sp. NPDC049258]|uniref:DUF4279 domain-containing protein n=1 Tax=Kitasatospora sp. NPDC049258 TaxID=3155394 RepID=UPI003426E004
MPVRQYASFVLSGPSTSAERMAAFLDLAPDETAGPPAGATHRWKAVCRESDLTVDEQIARILERLRPRAARIAELAGRLRAEGGGAALEVVRFFGAAGPAGGPSLFGWALDPEVLRFLLDTGADLDVDEHDLLAGAPPDPIGYGLR